MEIIHEDGAVIARQNFRRPSIYLDHWAIRKFSDDMSLQDRLVGLIKSKNGSLAFSPFNHAEFSNMESSSSAGKAEALLNRLVPNVFLTSFDVQEVEDFCNSPKFVGQRFSLPPDQAGFKILAQICIQNNGIWSFTGILTSNHEQMAKVRNIFYEVNSKLLQAITEQKGNDDFVNRARKIHPMQYPTPFRMALGELMRDLVLARDSNISINDMADLQHAVLTIICCDFVLLDNKWHNLVEGLKRRLRQAGISWKIAKTYSSRNNGVGNFLDDLASFETGGNT